jgi:ketosteroid isomerase-like protein
MMHMRSAVSVSMMCGLAACAPAPAPNHAADSVTEAEVLDAIRAYDTAWSRRDTAAVAQLLADSYLYFSSVGDLKTRRYILGDLLANPTYQLDSERSELRVQLYGSTAIVASRWRGTGTYEGKPVRDDQRCGLVLMKQDEGLRIVSEHCTQIIAAGQRGGGAAGQ